MKKYDIIFSNLDGTLIKTISGETFPKGIWDMQIRFEVLDKIKEVKPEYLLIVSNQGGIEKGFVSQSDFSTKLDYICASIREYCNITVDYYYCGTNNDNYYFKKPNIGMLEQAISDYDLMSDNNNHLPIYKKSEMLMIGNASGKPSQFSDSDKKTAENFCIDYLDVEDFCKTNFND